MEEYPRNLTEFEALFATEEACRQYLYRLRWPDGFRCPRCGGGKCWPVRVVLLQCVGCGHQTSVTAGTIFQDTRTSLKLWFYAMWWVTTQKNGASALGLQRVRSEEHTSELQSLRHLVCRLLLEKKKNEQKRRHASMQHSKQRDARRKPEGE